ncbi:MAG: efflux RND transporter permease subunit [Balneolaceae bacterium]|nr:efflux RND transporter permease subunit [Balneolaceae bacterium]
MRVLYGPGANITPWDVHFAGCQCAKRCGARQHWLLLDVDQGIEFEVLVQLQPRDKTQTTDLNNLQIETPESGFVPLSNVARIERFSGPTNILRINQERVTEVTADLSDIDLGTASARTRASLNQMDWPEGYRYELAGSAEDQAASFNYLMIAFMIAGILTYMVMASQFESLVEPFIIISYDSAGSHRCTAHAMRLPELPSASPSMVGLILLSGIVVK